MLLMCPDRYGMKKGEENRVEYLYCAVYLNISHQHIRVGYIVFFLTAYRFYARLYEFK